MASIRSELDALQATMSAATPGQSIKVVLDAIHAFIYRMDHWPAYKTPLLDVVDAEQDNTTDHIMYTYVRDALTKLWSREVEPSHVPPTTPTQALETLNAAMALAATPGQSVTDGTRAIYDYIGQSMRFFHSGTIGTPGDRHSVTEHVLGALNQLSHIQGERDGAPAQPPPRVPVAERLAKERAVMMARLSASPAELVAMLAADDAP